MPFGVRTSNDLFGVPRDVFTILRHSATLVSIGGKEYLFVREFEPHVKKIARATGALLFLQRYGFVAFVPKSRKNAILFTQSKDGKAFTKSEVHNTLSSISDDEFENLVTRSRDIRRSGGGLFPFLFENDCDSMPPIVGASACMEDIADMVRRVAPSRASVLFLGETGTGKELFAEALHRLSGRKDAPFVAVNCAAIPDTLLESELFGHERGSFTDAYNQRVGKFELANGGTLFLDEIGDLSLLAQGKVLRALSRREITRVGGSDSVPVDVRLVTATNKNLSAEVAEKRFREDLFYRISAVPLKVPPLRDRKEDIPLLLEFFLAKYAREMKIEIPVLHEGVADYMASLTWPGNVREFEYAVERVILCAKSPGMIVKSDFQEILWGRTIDAVLTPDIFSIFTPAMGKAYEAYGLRGLTATLEAAVIAAVLQKTGNNWSRASEILKVSRAMLKYKLGVCGRYKM